MPALATTESPPKADTTTKPNGTNGAAPAEQVQKAALKEMVRSPWNREVDTKTPTFKAFVENVRKHGIIQPLICRPLPGALEMTRKPGAPRLEIVAGERRWLAAGEAGLSEAPVIVRALSDREALEQQAIENEQRQDLNALERAEKYQQLLDQYQKSGMNKERAIAELCKTLSVGKTSEIGKSTVYEALRLLKLPPYVKDLVKLGKMPHSHAGVLAQLEDAPDVQAKLAKLIIEKPKGEHLWQRSRDAAGVVSFRETKELVDEQVKLSAARKKWLAAAETATKKGQRVLTEEEHPKFVNQYGSGIGGYVTGIAQCSEYSKVWPHKTYKELMGRHAPLAVLAHDSDYKVLYLYPKKEAVAAIVKAGHKKRKAGGGGGYDAGAYAREQARREELEARMEPVLQAAEKEMLAAAKKPNAKMPWRLIFNEILRGSIGGGGLQAICENHGWKTKGKHYDAYQKAILDRVGSMPENQIHGLLAEIFIIGKRGWDSYQRRFTEEATTLAKHYHVDLAKLTKELAPPPKKEAVKKVAGETPASTPKLQTPGRGKGQKGKLRIKKGAGSAKKKKGLTAALRSKLSSAMKARWAARRKAAK